MSSQETNFIEVKPRTHEEWEQDMKSYILIRLNKKEKLIEVRIMGYDRKVIADYKGKFPEDIYYKIIKDGHITKLQHAAYLGNELQKVYLAIKLDKDYVQDENLL